MTVAAKNQRNDRPVATSRKWHRIRQAVQVSVLLLFLYLLLGTRQESTTSLPLNLFFQLDPLAGISAMLASRSWIAPMALAGVTLLLTLAVGRAWCGWLCPLGTILDWTPARPQNRLDIPAYWRQVKYFFLFTILLAAILGSLTLLILDPLALLFQTITNVALPALSSVVTAAQSWLYGFGPLQPAVEWFDRLVRSSLPTEQPFFVPNLLIASVFAGVLALNAIRQRFWCRYLCPLGGLLGLVSGVAQIRHKVNQEKCNACQRCAIICPTGAIYPRHKFLASAPECTACLDCVEICPTNAIAFRSSWGLATNQPHDPSRRQFFASLGAAAVGAALLRIPVSSKNNPLLIRPPGASEEQLVSKCIRCGECAKVCPTGVIQPSFSDAD